MAESNASKPQPGYMISRNCCLLVARSVNSLELLRERVCGVTSIRTKYLYSAVWSNAIFIHTNYIQIVQDSHLCTLMYATHLTYWRATRRPPGIYGTLLVATSTSSKCMHSWTRQPSIILWWRFHLILTEWLNRVPPPVSRFGGCGCSTQHVVVVGWAGSRRFP